MTAAARRASLRQRRHWGERELRKVGTIPMRDEKLIKLETDLQKVPGVRDARVVGVDKPSEIHIVASGVRSPKQVVRDVQSLASAGYGMPIDHRIVSVVQLEEQVDSDEPEPVDAPPGERRPELESVVFASKGEHGWVRVRLKWPSGDVTEGIGRFGSDRETRAHGATNALIQALNPKLAQREVKVNVEEVALQKTRLRDLVVVQCSIVQEGITTAVVGSSFIQDDVATAAVQAALQALNRRLARVGG